MKKMTMANIVSTNATPILFLTLVPLSEFLLLTLLNSDMMNNIAVINNIILLLNVSSNDIVISLKKCEYESINKSYFPNMKLKPNTIALTIIKPVIGIIIYRKLLNLNITNDISTHNISNADG